MSRSRRKVPIFGVAGSNSEKLDKRIWHKRLRARERTRQVALPAGELGVHMPLHSLDVSSVWSMSKDGRRYCSKARQVKAADREATLKAGNLQERTSLKQRLLKKYMGK